MNTASKKKAPKTKVVRAIVTIATVNDALWDIYWAKAVAFWRKEIGRVVIGIALVTVGMCLFIHGISVLFVESSDISTAFFAFGILCVFTGVFIGVSPLGTPREEQTRTRC